VAALDKDLLGIYLNDHLAGASGGLELARRAARTHSRDRAILREIAEEIAEDREELRTIMTTLGIPVRRYKEAAGWAMEKVGRLKLNGRILSRSPLSDVLEVEALRLAVEAKAAGWLLLRRFAEQVGSLDPAQLDRLINRATRQAKVLEDLRVNTAVHAFAARASW
jgi:hypothetical protein